MAKVYLSKYNILLHHIKPLNLAYLVVCNTSDKNILKSMHCNIMNDRSLDTEHQFILKTDVNFQYIFPRKLIMNYQRRVHHDFPIRC